MADRSFIVVPKNGKVREFRVALWFFVVLGIFVFLGLGGLYGLWRGRVPKQKVEKQTQQLRAQNSRLEEQYSRLQLQYSNLNKYFKKIKRQEKEIHQIAGIQAQEKRNNSRLSDIFSFFTSSPPTQNISAERLLSDTRETKVYFDSLLKQIAENPDGFNRIPTIWPCGSKYTFISFGFGDRMNPFTGKTTPHLGVDFPCPLKTPVFAAASGTVVLIEQHKFFGKRMKIDHHNGFTTVYAHLQDFLVKRGQRIRKGEIIGRAGSTGYVTGPHLHYEVLYRNVHQNPEDYLFPLPDKKIKPHLSNKKI